MTTDFSDVCNILGEFYVTYKGDDKFSDFIEFNDLGLPLAHLVSEGLCEISEDGSKYIIETWSQFLSALKISEDEGFDSLDELMVQASVWPEAMNSKNSILIGHFAVDSGQAIIGDPCYLDEWEPWDDKKENFEENVKKAGEYSYLGACGVTLKQGYGELGTASAVAFSTGYGDGLYPVYAEINDDGRIVKITVNFL